ncbi:MAG: N-6 DNA methylase [Phycisphaeraceae bacterium]|nr:N-6 DNA methylase [Phycisphaeraceae bacterium]
MGKRLDDANLTKSDQTILDALRLFAASATANLKALVTGEPEAQLTNPTEAFLSAVGKALGYKRLIAKREPQLPGRLGRPDYAILTDELLVGYVELKEPGKGANPSAFKGHDRQQWNRFKSLPNLIYTDGNQWALYRDGQRIGKIARLSGDITTDGKSAVLPEDLMAIKPVLTDFFAWKPSIPTKKRGQIDLKGLADLLAPLCRMLRDDVTDALQDANSPLVQLAADWRQLLFPDADDEQFADAYAQTVTFALLLARSEGADPLTLDNAENALASGHSLLSRALQVLTDPNAQAEIAAPLNLLRRVIGEVPANAFAGPEDPWLYFYEDFLAIYDPKLRKDAGAYYTPVEVVHAQVRLIDDLLTNRLGKPLGFADPDVVTLDPAVGTGTYLLGVIDHALAKVRDQQGTGAVAGQASALARNIYGFEIMVGPFAVSELRVSRALQERGATLPADGTHVYLTDTLESPFTKPPQLPLYLKPIAEQHAKALKVKDHVPVIVCLGNPPYDRHEAAADDNKARTGGWVRWGDDGTGKAAILDAFLEPAKRAGHGGDLKNAYNLYVYFWRWALWKVFEHKTSSGPGIVSYISASSYLDGDAFCGMREHLRRQCDEIWVLDLGGEGRGTRKDDNVFAIQTPVAVAVAVRDGKADKNTPATVHYARLEGSHDEKLKALDAITDFASLAWTECPDNWHAPFRPAGRGEYFDFPQFIDLMSWQQNGVKAGRTWVIASDEETLCSRWRELCRASPDHRPALFKDSPTGCKADDAKTQLPPSGGKLKPIIQLAPTTPPPTIARFAYRSFDRQHLIADARTLDRASPPLWSAHSERQIYITSLFSQPLGVGPALTCAAHIPDLDHFRGSYGAKAVMPLYRDASASEPNILPGLLDRLRQAFGRAVTAEDFLAYVYGILAQPAFTDHFAGELGTRELRVPITKRADLFEQVRAAGARLLWLHTYGERFVPKGKHRGAVPKGMAKNIKAISGDAEDYPDDYRYDAGSKTLHVGRGAFAPVAPEVFEFEVSGLKVVRSWLDYRMKEPKGKRSSPLDGINPTQWPSQFTTELLELLWVLEATVAAYPDMARLLDEVVKSECFKADELPAVPDEARKPPKKQEAGLFDSDDED